MLWRHGQADDTASAEMGDWLQGAALAGTGHDHDAWSRALADELLDGRFEAQPLYLFVEPSRLRALGATVGAPLETAVARSLAWASGEGLFQPHLRAATRWEAGGKRGPPPFLSVLVALTLAAESMVSDHNFSVTNYRDRLCRLLGAQGDRAEKVKRDLPTAVRLWHALNDWLDDWEGALGLPTARVLGRLVNVGYPISQAIVREGDRQAMREAFASYGLTPRRRVGATEMTTYLADWIGRGQAPKNLSRLWADASVQERIAQVACDELEHGRVTAARPRAGGAVAPPSRLDWLAELGLDPMPHLELYLVSRAERDEAEGAWQVGPRSDAGGLAAVESCRDHLELRWLPQLDALSLEPWDQIGGESLFSGVLELVRDGSPGAHLLRSPGAVIAMAYDERDSRYHEVTRAQLLDRLLVLAHDNQADAVARHLEVYARPGFRRFRPDVLRQLPEGWQVFSDVTLVQGVDETRHPRLAPLCATPAIVIGLSGGLRIGQSTWHVSQAPEALAVVDPETAPFRALLLDRRSETRRNLGAFTGRGVLDLAALGLPAGDYELQIERSRNGEAVVVRRATFRLRSADHPRPAGVQRDAGLGLDLTQPWSLLSAERASGAPPSAWLRGGVWPSDVRSQTAEASAVLSLPLPMRRANSVDVPAVRGARRESRVRTHSCTIGPHRWTCEPGESGDDFRTLKWQECQECHRFEWTRNRGVTRPSPARRPQQAPVRAPPALPRYTPLCGAGPDAYARLLDALSYMGAGSTDQFRGLCAGVDPDPWFARSALRGLSALGHLDVEFDRRSVRPRSWQVTQPCLVETAAGSWVLTGARSKALAAGLFERLMAGGLTLRESQPEGGPPVLAVSAAEEELSKLVLGDLVTPLGKGVSLSPALGDRIASAAAGLGGLPASLPAFQPGAQGLERFDLVSGGWRGSDFDCAGAYRLEYWGRTYGYAGADDVGVGQMRLGDAAIVKHLAARTAGQSLLAYDPSRQALFVPLGAELPPLLERAAVACSGRLPALRAELGQLEYRDVPIKVAQALQRSLQAGGPT